ncbi:lantibiotic dehydratase [Niabella defluvii]|nr:lantibiotic dehydratase [Niabella sp. I65]
MPFTNSSYYVVQDEIRFLQRRESDLQLAAIDYQRDIEIILQNCATPITPDQLQIRLSETVDSNLLDELIPALLDIQLLLTSQHSNIIGTDYFQRICHLAKPWENSYLIAERKIIEGGFNKKIFCNLPDLAGILSRIMPVHEPPELSNFKNAFLRRFEQAEIPIMLALDPEIGVGYGDQEQAIDASHLETLVGLTPEKVVDINAPLNEQLFRKLLEHAGSYVIDIEALKADIGGIQDLPNSIAATCTVTDDLLWLDMIGGASATSMSGRFALAVPEIENYCHKIAADEQAANPNVLFFDVGYSKEGKVDNVNRRPVIYDLQLNILNYDTSPQPLSLTDIYVSVQMDKVVLRSRSLNKRLLPRMASAYNYRRSDLSVFRLFMDIQNQGIQTNLTFKLPNFLNGLQFYPRIQYKNIIVSPATWRLPVKELRALDKGERTYFLQSWLSLRVQTTHIKTGKGDQTLCLEINAMDDLGILVNTCLKETDVLVEETTLPKKGIVQDTNGAVYLPQVVVTLQHQERIVAPLTIVQEQFPAIAKSHVLSLGNEWLYFQIFCPVYRSDQILNKIADYIDRTRQYLHKWFFIRYDEGGPHIRLRLNLKNTSVSSDLINVLSHVLQAELESGIVADIKLCIYRPEVHRYYPEQMENVESHFHVDSEFAISAIGEMLSSNARYRLCMDLYQSVESSDAIESVALDHMVSKMAENYNKEHYVKGEQFKAINNDFRSFRQEPSPSLSLISTSSYKQLKQSLIDTLFSYPGLIRPKILAELLHMHINRLFISQQRTHEMVFYNFLVLEQKVKNTNLTHRQL